MLFSRDCRVVAIGAHPDDIEYGCLGTLLLAEARGALVRSIVLTSGSLGGSSRRVESAQAFRSVALKPPLFGDEPDGLLSANAEVIKLVANELSTADIVLTMTQWDTHQDHRAVKDIVLAAVRRRPVTLLGYHVMSSTAEFPINLLVDISEMYELKLTALGEHKSQAHKEYFGRDWIDQWHTHRLGSTMGLHKVEAFHTYQVFV